MPSSAEKEIIFAVIIVAVVFLILSSFAILLIYNYFRVRQAREKDILKAVFQTQEAEQNRISEDLHDDIGGKLSALKLQNELLSSNTLNEDDLAIVTRNSKLIDVVVKDIRLIVRNQSSKYLLKNGLKSELSDLCSQYKSLKGIKFDVIFSDEDFNLPTEFQINIFRVLQELLHNSIKHSNATTITMSLFQNINTFEVTYSDNGKGFENMNPENAGMGLKNIQTRIKLYNGTLSFNSVPNKKTSFEIHFPMNALT